LGRCQSSWIGEKDADACNDCLTNQVPDILDSPDCGKWPALWEACGTMCQKDHPSFTSCADPEARPPSGVTVQEQEYATPARCRQCLLARDPDVTSCLPGAPDFLGETVCLEKMTAWLGMCADECPGSGAETLDDMFDSNLVDAGEQNCERCVFAMPDGADCLWNPTEECCESWRAEWADDCKFSCSTTTRRATEQKVCKTAVGNVGGDESDKDDDASAHFLTATAALFAAIA
jgi:hypothetical protein